MEYHNFRRENFPNSFLDQVHEIQKADICCDLRFVFDFGELWIHKSALLLYGKSIWWASLLGESFPNVVILPGVTQVEVEKFILTIYGQNIVTDDDTEPFHGFSDAEILAAGGTMRGPTPSSDPSGYSPQQQPPSNSHAVISPPTLVNFYASQAKARYFAQALRKDAEAAGSCSKHGPGFLGAINDDYLKHSGESSSSASIFTLGDVAAKAMSMGPPLKRPLDLETRGSPSDQPPNLESPRKKYKTDETPNDAPDLPESGNMIIDIHHQVVPLQLVEVGQHHLGELPHDRDSPENVVSERNVENDDKENNKEQVSSDTLKEQLYDDIKLEPYELMHQCSTCGKGFKSKQDLYMHNRNNHLLQDSQCHQCGKCFKSKKSLENHTNTVHKIVKCNSCDQFFKAGSIMGHRRICQTFYPCSECDFVTKNKKDLSAHKKTSHQRHKHQRMKPFRKCPICSYKSRSAYNLKIHVSNVHGQKHACNICDKQFTKERSLDKHKRDFHGPKHCCQECNKKFIRQGSLENHVKSDHRRERLFTRDGHMLLFSTEKVIKKKRYHFCQKCDYKNMMNFNGLAIDTFSLPLPEH